MVLMVRHLNTLFSLAVPAYALKPCFNHVIGSVHLGGDRNVIIVALHASKLLVHFE